MAYNVKKGLSMSASLVTTGKKPYTTIKITNTGSSAITVIAYKGKIGGSTTIHSMTVPKGKGCKNHDLCYGNKGRHKCSCDKTFLNYINNNYKKMSGASQKAMAKTIKAWLQIKTKNVTKKGGNFSCRK